MGCAGSKPVDTKEASQSVHETQSASRENVATTTGPASLVASQLASTDFIEEQLEALEAKFLRSYSDAQRSVGGNRLSSASRQKDVVRTTSFRKAQLQLEELTTRGSASQPSASQVGTCKRPASVGSSHETSTQPGGGPNSKLQTSPSERQKSGSFTNRPTERVPSNSSRQGDFRIVLKQRSGPLTPKSHRHPSEGQLSPLYSRGLNASGEEGEASGSSLAPSADSDSQPMNSSKPPARVLPGRFASAPVISREDGWQRVPQTSTHLQTSQQAGAEAQQQSPERPHGQASPPESATAAGSGGSASGGQGHRSLRNPSRLSLAAGPRPSAESSEQYNNNIMLTSMSMTRTNHSSSLAQLQKAVENLMMQDSEVYHKVQASMRGISSLAKETTKLEMGRDATGATCINQYVVVKTLGRGSFGKVKLCLNTLDGCLYAVKMVNRSFILKLLQKPAKQLRRRVPPRNSSERTVWESSKQGPEVAASITGGSGQLSDNRLQAMRNESHSFNALLPPSRNSLDETGNNPLESIMREIAVLKKLDHPNVVKLFEVIDPPGSSYMMMVMEYMEKGPVMETKGQSGFARLPERLALDFFRQALAGLDYLHYNNVVHGDLKPENLLVSSDGRLKIGDFGSSRVMGDSTASSKVSCTPAFQPPEVLSAAGYEDPFAADVWALGVCLYCFVYGGLPFTGSCVLDISNAICKGVVRYPAEIPASQELKDLLKHILQKDPLRRATLQNIMQHPWVTDSGRSPLPSLKQLVAPPKIIEVTKHEARSAIDRSSLVSLMRARLKEKMYNPGEWLYKEDEEAHCVYMIMRGVVEITTHLSSSSGMTPGEGLGASGSAVGDSVLGTDEELDHSLDVDLDESFTLDHNGLLPDGLPVVDGKLHIDRNKARELKKRMKTILIGRNTDYVTEVKGPGQVIGEVSLDKTRISRHQHGARARDQVTVVKLTEENFFKALLQMYGPAAAGTTAAGSLPDGAGTAAMESFLQLANMDDNESGAYALTTGMGLHTIHDDDGRDCAADLN